MKKERKTDKEIGREIQYLIVMKNLDRMNYQVTKEKEAKK